MAAAQWKDEEMATYHTVTSGLVLQDVQFGPTDTTLLCNISTGQPRPVVPAIFIRTVFDVLHGLSHPSIWAMQKLLTDRYVWHGICKQVGSWARSCKSCQEAKIQQHVRATMQTLNVLHRRFDQINIDIVGPLPSSQGYPPAHNSRSIYQMVRSNSAKSNRHRDVCTRINLPLDRPFQYTVGHDFQ